MAEAKRSRLSQPSLTASGDNISNDLFLLMLNLAQLEDETRAWDIFMQAAATLWPGFLFRRTDSPYPTQDAVFPVATRTRSYGYIAVEGNLEARGERDLALLSNAVNLLAVITETIVTKKETNSRYQYFIAHAPEALFIFDERARLKEINHRACEILGYSVEELKGRPFRSIIPAESLAVIKRLKTRLDAFGEGNAIVRILRKDGERRSMDLNAIRTPEREYVVFCRDRTVEERMRRRLKESRNRFKQVVETVREMFWIYDISKKQLLYLSPAAKRIFGSLTPSLSEDPARFFPSLHQEDQDLARRKFKKLAERGIPLRDRYRLKHPSKGERWLRIMAYRIAGKKPEASRLVGVAEDITEHVLREQGVENALREKEVLLKEIHHRVKNNIQIILSLMNLQVPDIQNPCDLILIQETMNRIKSIAMIHELLYASRDLSHIDFSDYLRQLGTYLAGIASDPRYKRPELRYELSPVTLSIEEAVPAGLVCSELVSNAFLHAFPEGEAGNVTIGLRLSPDRDRIELTVRDDGRGINGKPAAGKSHLGMVLIEALANQLNGSLTLETGPGGTRATLSFPGNF